LGSQNFDWRALDHIHELGIRFKNTDGIQVYRGIFNADWNYCEVDDGKSWECQGFSISKNYHMRDDKYGEWMTLMPTISPAKFDHVNADSDIDWVLSMINQAKSEVNLQFLTYNSNSREGYWGELDSALIQAAVRHVKVKLIVSDWSIGKVPIESLKRLAAIPNIEVKYSSIPDYSKGYISFARVEHCKYVVADSNTWIGSANAEKSYFYNTRNVGLVIEENQKFSSRVREIFYKDWNGPYTHYIKPEEEYIGREHGEK
jgi:phosphatidylserine/phosphatidylglycerophosphate/cardiolipin synthase-like enzyme